ncbi:hypothetical protein VrSk94_18440 [Vibrio rotiferianus]
MDNTNKLIKKLKNIKLQISTTNLFFTTLKIELGTEETIKIISRQMNWRYLDELENK